MRVHYTLGGGVTWQILLVLQLCLKLFSFYPSIEDFILGDLFLIF